MPRGNTNTFYILCGMNNGFLELITCTRDSQSVFILDDRKIYKNGNYPLLLKSFVYEDVHYTAICGDMPATLHID